MKTSGLVMIFTGKGKGKTSAALGISLRSLGHGFKAVMIQFIKGEWFYGEITSSKRLEPDFEIIAAGKGFIGILDDDHTFEEHKKAANDALQIAYEKAGSGLYDLVVLDEINYALKLNLITEENVIRLIKSRAASTSLILTGNYLSETLLENADLVTEMKELKHPFQKGQRAKKGIDF